MEIRVHMLAYCEPGTVRLVQIPDDTPGSSLLGLTYQHGQNDFQPRPCPSVSVGDVIELPDGTLHLVAPVGFKQLTADELAEYAKLPRRDRVFRAHDMDAD